MRPTALSDRGILEQVLSNTTPKVELGNPVEHHVAGKMAGIGINDGGEVRGEENERGMNSTDEETPKKPKRNTLVSGVQPMLPPIAHEKAFEDGGVFDME